MSEFFLVCGLGYLGQHCVLALKKFGVKVIAIEKNPSLDWELKDLAIDDLIIGDCSFPNVLSQTQIQYCRAALIVTTVEKVNIETAIAIRRLNPNTRLIVRSDRENFNELLTNQLGNLVAYEPKHLPANAYALSALGKETIGFLDLQGGKMTINRQQIPQNHPWQNYKSLDELNNRNRRIISHNHDTENDSLEFYQWNPEDKVRVNDTFVYVNVEDNFSLTKGNLEFNRNSGRGWQRISPYITQVKDGFRNFWKVSRKQQIRRVAMFSGVIVLFLLIIGTILFKVNYPNASIYSAFSATVILLLGGFADLFGEFDPITEFPLWLQLFSLSLTIVGTAFVGVLYALLTEALLSSKFQFNTKRPPIPKENHIIIIGFGRLGQKVAEKLQDLKQPTVAVTFNPNIDLSTAVNVPLISGYNIQDSLELSNVDKAKSIIIVTDDDIVNIEVALMSQKVNPHCNLVIRTNGDTLTENLTELLPNATIIDPYAVVAEAFTGAAFGENILHLCRLQQQTLLVTQYDIEKNDTLIDLLLSEVAYGYGVIPIMYTSCEDLKPLPLPSDDIPLNEGDSLIVLATIEGLKSIEQGIRKEPHWAIEILSVQSNMGLFEGANAITRVSGCPLKMARETMENLPRILPVKLYQHQAVRLRKILNQNQVTSRINTLTSLVSQSE